MSSENHEESGYDLDMNLLTMLTKHVFLYHMRSGLVGKKENHLRPICLRGWIQ